MDDEIDPELVDVDPELAVDAAARPALDGATLVAVAAGGALGTLARAGIAELVPTTAGRFPWGTFAVNVTGAFLLGVLVTLIVGGRADERLLRPFALTGFLGGYTTFSTYVVEADRLARAGHPGLASVYALGSVVAGVGAVYVAQRTVHARMSR